MVIGLLGFLTVKFMEVLRCSFKQEVVVFGFNLCFSEADACSCVRARVTTVQLRSDLTVSVSRLLFVIFVILRVNHTQKAWKNSKYTYRW